MENGCLWSSNRRYAVYPRAVAPHYGAYRLLPILSAPARRACFIGLRPFHVPTPGHAAPEYACSRTIRDTTRITRRRANLRQTLKVGLRIGKDTTLHRSICYRIGAANKLPSGDTSTRSTRRQQCYGRLMRSRGMSAKSFPGPGAIDCPDNLRIPFSWISVAQVQHGAGTDHAARPKRSRPQPRRHTGGRGNAGDRT